MYEFRYRFTTSDDEKTFWYHVLHERQWKKSDFNYFRFKNNCRRALAYTAKACIAVTQKEHGNRWETKGGIQSRDERDTYLCINFDENIFTQNLTNDVALLSETKKAVFDISLKFCISREHRPKSMKHHNQPQAKLRLQ